MPETFQYQHLHFRRYRHIVAGRSYFLYHRLNHLYHHYFC